MKWLPLKMYYLPLIFQEINYVTEEYIQIINKIRDKQKNEGEKEKGRTEKQKDINGNDGQNENEEDEYENLIKQYNGIRESISKRINELEEFYEDNIEDVRVSNFEKARLRLKKLLMYTYENINGVVNSSQEKNIFIKESNNNLTKRITEDKKRKIIENNISLEKQIIKERSKEEEKVKRKLIGDDTKVPKKTFKNQYVNKKKVIKITGEEGFLKQTENGKRVSLARFVRDSENTGGFDYNDYSKCKEILFKIKLNPNEYKTLLKEKKNVGKLSPYLFK